RARWRSAWVCVGLVRREAVHIRAGDLVILSPGAVSALGTRAGAPGGTAGPRRAARRRRSAGVHLPPVPLRGRARREGALLGGAALRERGARAPPGRGGPAGELGDGRTVPPHRRGPPLGAPLPRVGACDVRPAGPS